MSTTREYLKASIDPSYVCLEIGPYHSPILDHNKKNNFSIDVFTRKSLIEKANSDPNLKRYNISISNIPETNYLLSKDQDYDIEKCVDRKFDIIISSHNLEHLPNLIKELNKYEKILKDNGKIFAFIPDCNFEFDYLRNKSRLADIIDDYYMDRKMPSFKSILDFQLYYEPEASTFDLWKHYLNEGIHDERISESDIKSKKDIDYLFEKSKLDYIDTHSYTFTSFSFEKYIKWLNKFKFINLHIEKIEHTQLNSQEFFVILAK